MNYALKSSYYKFVFAMFLGLCALSTEPATAGSNFGMGLSLSYNNNKGGSYPSPIYSPIYGQPVMGYGSASANFGIIGGVGGACGCGGGMYAGGCGGYFPGMMGGGGMMGGPGMMGGGMMPSLPPVMPPMLPPNLSMPNMGWGPGYASYPNMQSGASCLPCNAGMQPYPIYPVAGGPQLQPISGGYIDGGYSQGGGYVQGGRGNNIYSVNGQTIIDLSGSERNAWEIDDSGSIVWATAIGLGMQASNVYPVAFPRNQPTFVPTLGIGSPVQPGQQIRPQFGH